ncbi:hypothetical protein GPX89_39495 [Nocardia sp. ET3-3]|uniref:Uncharacterized protein n=1 Tax=Nocardia terrae TaxID=2675851 RepID=A0A7K1VA02_9NOCA|nr:hypothetical protein [Nocardia terrae]MVU83311.1 hypothetical protein [Nocardia terrae]
MSLSPRTREKLIDDGLERFATAQLTRYTRWERSPATRLMKYSPESIRGPSRFWLHALADEIEFKAKDALNTSPEGRSKGWERFLGDGVLREFLSAVTEFTALSDEELEGYGLHQHWTPAEYRALVVAEAHAVVDACLRQSIQGIESRVLDLQMMLDPDGRPRQE